jgi:DNA-binding transcriptional MerR regulator
MPLTVGQMAELAGVTVRTLHHYDGLDLLTPGTRSAAGYRLYENADCERLQEILFYRELGLGLDEIKSMLQNPEYDRAGALRDQRDPLALRRDRLQTMIGVVETALDAHEKGITMTKEEMFEVFGDFDPKVHEAEVEERWVGPALQQSRRRTSKYDKDQWKDAMAEGEATTEELAERLRAGDAPDDAATMDLAEQHRLHIDRWFYECSREMHTGLGDMYVADPRFTEYYEKYASGLAEFVKSAIHANRARQEV